MSWIRGRWTVVSLLLTTPVTLVVFAICALAQVVTTTVTDTIYRANGSPAGGTVVVSWPAFTTSIGQAITAGSTSATIAANGVLTMALTPNAGATPLGTYYTVVYHLDGGGANREFWVVPASSSPVRIISIRSSVLPTAVAMQTVSKNYVDTAIAAAVAGHPLDASNPYVLKAGDTMTGPLTLPGDPTASSQAATKNYVDASINAVAGGISQKVATLPSTTQTVAQPPGTQLEVNRQKCILWMIDVHATNIGKVGVSLGDDAGALEVYPLIPTGTEDRKLDSTKLHATLLQPGESDQVLLEPLYLDQRYKTIQVNSYYSVPPRRWLKLFSGKPHYWAVRSVADLDLKATPEAPAAKDKKAKDAKDAAVDTAGASCSEQ